MSWLYRACTLSILGMHMKYSTYVYVVGGETLIHWGALSVSVVFQQIVMFQHY